MASSVPSSKTSSAPLSNSLLRKIATSKKSGTLNLRDEELTVLPHEAYHREDLMSQESWFDVVELTQMLLSHNEIEALPDDWDIVPELKLLDVSYNQLKELPRSLLVLKELRSIDISHNKFTELQEEIGDVPNLMTLSSADNQIALLPQTFGINAKNLTKLDLSGNVLTTLPVSLSYAEALTNLNLEKNSLSEIPGGVLEGLKSLQELDLSKNQLTLIPAEIQHLKYLKVLTVRHNQLMEISHEISGCERLVEVHLGYNKIDSIPDSIGTLTSLLVLDLNSNNLKNFPAEPCKNLRLTTLDLGNNNISSLPGELGLVTTLRRVALEGNPLRTIRRELIVGPTSRLLESLRKKLPLEESNQELGAFGGRVMITGDPLTQIKNQCRSYVINNSPGELDLSDMGLKQIMEEVWESIDFISTLKLNNNDFSEFDGERLNEASALRCLWMQNCQLQNWPLPTESESLQNLQILDLSRNRNLQIPYLDPFESCANSLVELNLNGVLAAGTLDDGALGCLQSLKVISLSMTNLNRFPPEFVQMPTLCSIDLSQNGIQSLPDDITVLTNLEFLDVSNNSIKNLPVMIGFMHPTLKTLKVEGNILKTLRRSMLSKGTAQLLEYLRERAPTSDP